MSQHAVQPADVTGQTTTGRFNYLVADTESSLYRNGKVLMQRATTGNTAGSTGVNVDKQMLTVHDARDAEPGAFTCERNGFELLDQPLATTDIDFMDHKDVVARYYQECEEIVHNATGARAFAFDHNVRSAGGHKGGKAVSGGQNVQEPAHIIHGDYTLTSAPDRLRQLAQEPGINDTLRDVLKPGETPISQKDVDKALAPGGRFAIINVWRNILADPVATHPLALCDSQTVAPEDLVVFEIHYEDRIGENYFAKASDAHRMYYFPKMTRDEALLIKQWDSAGPLAQSDGAQGDGSDATAPCTFSFHTAFYDAATPDDAPDRWSIEVRCMVIYD
ncbi:MAG: CmcJ/NvfI family oxidoreductase [Candidatus Phaeomarinobacter sp.]